MNRLQLPVGGEIEFTKEEDNRQAVHYARVVEVSNDPMAHRAPCAGCLFEEGTVETCFHIACTRNERTDEKDVKFIEVKGGGE